MGTVGDVIAVEEIVCNFEYVTSYHVSSRLSYSRLLTRTPAFHHVYFTRACTFLRI